MTSRPAAARSGPRRRSLSTRGDTRRARTRSRAPCGGRGGERRTRRTAGRLAEKELHGQAEDGGVRTNPEREREDPGRRESGISPEGARRIRQVGERLLQPSELPGRPCLFLDAQGGTELATGPGPRVRTCHPVLLQLLRPHLDMEGGFLVEL